MLRRFLPGGLAMLLFVGPPAAQAGEAVDLAARVADALGGRDRLAAVTGYQLIADVEGLGLEGRSVTWSAFPARQRGELDLGPLSLLLVMQPEGGWHRDHNGHVEALDEHQLADVRTSLYLDAFRPWLDAREESGLTVFDPVQDGEIWRIHARIQPPGGNPADLWIDAGTGLPVQVRQRDESGLGLEVVRMSDYREVDGIQVPFLVESFHDQLPENRSIYRVREVVWNAPVDEALFAPPIDQSDATFPPGVTALTLPMTVEAGHLFVPGHLVGDGRGADGLLMLDTAATVSMLDRGIVERLGLETEGALSGLAVGGTMDVALVRLPFLEVGGVYLEHQLLGVTELTAGIREQLGVEVVGILGYDFFSRMVVTLDYSGACMLHHGNTWRVPEGGVTLPLRFQDQQPTVRGSLDAIQEGEWRLDTGADALTVHARAAREWKLLDRHGPGRPIGALGMGGETSSRLLLADRFRLGPYSLEQPSVMMPENPTGTLAAEGTVGNLGNSVLERFTVTVDFSGRRLHLLPGPLAGEDLRVHTVDFDVGWVGTRVEVLWVEAGGEGERLGLRVGQPVLRVGGRSASRWSEGELTRLWAGGGPERVTLVVRDGRGRRRIEVPIPPAP